MIGRPRSWFGSWSVECRPWTGTDTDANLIGSASNGDGDGDDEGMKRKKKKKSSQRPCRRGETAPPRPALLAEAPRAPPPRGGRRLTIRCEKGDWMEVKTNDVKDETR